MSHTDKEYHVSKEAAKWLLALEEDPENGELSTRFDEWLQESPEHEAAWSDALGIYDDIGNTEPAHREYWEESEVAHSEGEGSEKPEKWGRRKLLYFFASAAAACLAFFVWPSISLKLEADYIASTGEKLTLTLDDGSEVALGGRSALKVDFDGNERRVELLQGEAFFEVKPDAERPFSVEAGDLRTVVLGTAFNVRLKEESAAVSVEQGRVSVHQITDTAELDFLEAGEWFELEASGRIEKGKVDSSEIGLWREGRILARDRPLSDVVESLRRYYSGVIILQGEALGQKRVTGVYKIDDPAAALRALASSAGAEVRQVSPWVIVVSSESVD
ncbi:MAG: FecR domain-containing protein [Verrucomicrobiota bacterium]